MRRSKTGDEKRALSVTFALAQSGNTSWMLPVCSGAFTENPEERGGQAGGGHKPGVSDFWSLCPSEGCTVC